MGKRFLKDLVSSLFLVIHKSIIRRIAFDVEVICVVRILVLLLNMANLSQEWLLKIAKIFKLGVLFDFSHDDWQQYVLERASTALKVLLNLNFMKKTTLHMYSMVNCPIFKTYWGSILIRYYYLLEFLVIHLCTSTFQIAYIIVS